MKDESLFLVALLDLGRKFERTAEKLNILIWLLEFISLK